MAKFSVARALHCRVRRSEGGYVLLTLLLVVSLMVIAAAALLPAISFEIKRDREQEMIHRGVQYSRAIRTYYKKFGRYPTRLEDLDNTNNLRYLRKHYKDPLNKNQDFRLLHFGDPDLKLAGSIGGGGIAGATPAGAAMNASSPSGSAFGGGLAGSGFGNSGVNSSGVFAQPSAFGGNSNSGFGPNPNPQKDANQQAQNSASGSDPSQLSAQVAPGTAQGDAISSGQQIIGGGPIVGVASISKKETIREFNKKRKYNEWQFIYDPSADRGGLITTPYQPALQGFASQPGQSGQTGNSTGSPFGQPGQSGLGQSSFGQSQGLSNNPNPGSGPPIQPPPNPPEQQ